MTLALVLCGGLVLDAILGEPRWLWKHFPHPAILMGRLVEQLERRLNTSGFQRLKGCFCLVLLVFIAVTIGMVISFIGPIAEVLLAAVLFAQKSLVQHVRAVADGLRSDLATGRQAVSMIVSRDTTDMDPSQVARACIESAAENLSDGVFAPAFWFLLAGAPGLMAYKMINTADSMIGYRTERFEDFGWAAARADDLVNLIPARLTALVIATAGRVSDFTGIAADARLHRSPNAGWPEAAMSRALGIALAGPRAYDGKMLEFAWVNAKGRRVLTSKDIDETVTMLWKAWVIVLALSALIAIVTL